MAKIKTFQRIQTIEPESLISFSFNDTITDSEGNQCERMEFIANTSTYGMDPLDEMILVETLTELFNNLTKQTKERN